MFPLCPSGFPCRVSSVPGSDGRQPAPPQETGPTRQQSQGALVCGVQPLPAAPGCAGGRFLVSVEWTV